MRFIGINVYGRDAHKQGALPIVADAREALRALHSAARDAGIRPNPSYQREIAAARQGWQRKVQEELVPDVGVAELLAHAGQGIAFVPGYTMNFKLTTFDDLELAQRIAAQD